MCKFVFIALVLVAASPAFAHKDRIEAARSLTVGFQTGETATFALSKGAISAITIRVGTVDYLVPASDCAKLHDIHFESASFAWNGSYSSVAKADYFYLQFDMGAESEKAFGEFPQIKLMFQDGKFEKAVLTKKTSKNSWQDSKP